MLWMLSDGKNLVYATYTFMRQDGEPPADEVAEAEAIVHSIEF